MIQKLSGSKLYFSPIILSLAYLLGFDPFGYQLLGLLSVSVLFYFALKNKTYIIMGVCGCGKSSVGDLLASNTEGAFIDAVSFHPPKNVEKMSAGVPLNDQDRKKWLIAIGQAIKAHEGPWPLFFGCSALKRKYRNLIDFEADGQDLKL